MEGNPLPTAGLSGVGSGPLSCAVESSAGKYPRGAEEQHWHSLPCPPASLPGFPSYGGICDGMALPGDLISIYEF